MAVSEFIEGDVNQWINPFKRSDTLTPLTTEFVLKDRSNDQVIRKIIRIDGVEVVIAIETDVDHLLGSVPHYLQFHRYNQGYDNPFGEVAIVIRPDSEQTSSVCQIPTSIYISARPLMDTSDAERYLQFTEKYRAQLDLDGSLYSYDYGYRSLENEQGQAREVLLPCDYEDPTSTLYRFSRIRTRFINKQLLKE